MECSSQSTRTHYVSSLCATVRRGLLNVPQSIQHQRGRRRGLPMARVIQMISRGGRPLVVSTNTSRPSATQEPMPFSRMVASSSVATAASTICIMLFNTSWPSTRTLSFYLSFSNSQTYRPPRVGRRRLMQRQSVSRLASGSGVVREVEGAPTISIRVSAPMCIAIGVDLSAKFWQNTVYPYSSQGTLRLSSSDGQTSLAVSGQTHFCGKLRE